jgi:hypothetical protein
MTATAATPTHQKRTPDPATTTGKDATGFEVAGRFAGPDGIGNGGYCCGLFAGLVEGPATVKLLRPVPLERSFEAREGRDSVIEIRHAGETIAEVAESAPLTGLEPPVRPTVAEAALAARQSAFDSPAHPFPRCFVCGPDHSNGLGLHPGFVSPDHRVQAAPFVPPEDDSGPDGATATEIVWAALDCPSFPGRLLGKEVPYLLGSMSTEILAPVPTGEACVAVGWELAQEGRKLECASTILSSAGEILARCRTLWIALRPKLAEAVLDHPSSSDETA